MAQNLFAACRVGGELVAKRIRLDNSVQQAIKEVFHKQENNFWKGISDEVNFDGSWKPDDDEVLRADIPEEGSVYVEAIESGPLATAELDTAAFDTEGIKALFTGTSAGGKTKVLVQSFSPQQVLSRRFSLLQHGNTFRRLSDPAFTLDTALTCVIEDKHVKFKSFAKLRSIMDLRDLYRSATDQEVKSFALHARLDGNGADLVMITDQVSRKLIHAVLERGTLDNYSVSIIQKAAQSVGITVGVNKGKLQLPTASADLKTLLRFLDDGLYEAPLTKQRYITNSKRPAS